MFFLDDGRRSITLLFSLGVILIGIWAVGRVTLGPLNRDAGSLRPPTRFQLSDIAWLFLQLQLVLAFGAGVIGVQDPILTAFATGFVLVTIVIWIYAVQLMSRARITQPLRRAIVIMVLLPGTVGSGVAASFAFLTCLAIHPVAIHPVPWFLAAWVAWPLSMIALRQLSKWTRRGCEPLPVASKETRGADPDAATPPPDSLDQASNS